MPGLETDWMCIAASGATIDGRVINDQWMVDVAETYDPRVYTAMIWPRHDSVENRKYTYNLGRVAALKLEDEDGVKKLYAKLSPNQFLIEANKAGQKLFTSIELVEDFAGTGRDYLYGLAATDVPASLYTDRMEFDASGNEMKLRTFSVGESLSFTMQDKQQKNSFWSRFFNLQPAEKKTEDDMEKEQFDQLIKKLNDSDKRFTAIEEQLKTFSQQSNKPDPANVETDPNTPPPDDKAPQWFEQYSQGFDSKLDELTKRFDQIDKKEVTKLPDGNPGGNEDSTWL
ncbi:GPO family capsid scaffolding protein [Enterobacter ludwigii]|uniref:GPO family capsid scaffolding protein n=1 Tax=Enterobacter ludwigii TaxID=299767 RepID=UPI003076587C